MGTLAARLGVPVIKASKGLAPSSHFPVGFRLPVASARHGAARHAWHTRPDLQRPGEAWSTYKVVLATAFGASREFNLRAE